MIVHSETVTTNDRIYSKEQAKSGEELYKTNCLICHDKKYFRPVFKAWSGQSLGTFFLVMNASMPESNPGSLHIEEGGKLIGESDFKDNNLVQEEFEDWKSL